MLVSKILIIPLFIVALVSGPLFEILMGEILSILSLVISVTSTLLVLIINFLLQLRKINNKSRQLYIDLKNTKRRFQNQRQLTELQKNWYTTSQKCRFGITNTRGLMKQAEKVGEPRPPKTLPKKSIRWRGSEPRRIDQSWTTWTFSKLWRCKILTFLDRGLNTEFSSLYVSSCACLKEFPLLRVLFPNYDNEGNIIRPEQYLPDQMLLVSQQLWTPISDVFSSFARHDESSLTFYSSVIFQIRHLQILSFSLTL